MLRLGDKSTRIAVVLLYSNDLVWILLTLTISCYMIT